MKTAAVPLSEIVKRAGALPSAPWLLPKLMEQLADADADADQIEALIKMDSGLASGTLSPRDHQDRQRLAKQSARRLRLGTGRPVSTFTHGRRCGRSTRQTDRDCGARDRLHRR